MVGFLLVTQIKGQANVTHQLKSQTEEDLGNIIRELSFETDALQREVAGSTVQLLKYSQAEQSSEAVVADSKENLKRLRIIIGDTEVIGPGVIVTLVDANALLTGYDILDLVQELKAAGAEAISVNGIRVINRSAFTLDNSAVYLNHIKIRSPYKIKAIGDSSTLSGAITLLGGIRDTLSNFEGVTVGISETRNLKVEARQQIAPFIHAEKLEIK